MPATSPWFQGDDVPLTWTNTDDNGNPQDAASLSSVVLTVVLPDGTSARPAFTRTGVGTYECNYPSVQSGHHIYLWISTDATYPGSFTDSFEVASTSDLTIVSLADAKEMLKLTGTTEFDARIMAHNAAVTNVVEYYCGPVVQQTVIERLPSRGPTQPLSRPPVIELVAWTQAPPGMAALGIPVPSPPSPMYPVSFFGIAYPLSQLYADPDTGIVTHTSYLPFIYGYYMWQYTAGRPVIPPCIYDGSEIILKHLFEVEHPGTSAAAASMAAGDEETVMTPMGFAVPARALELLTPELAASRMVAV